MITLKANVTNNYRKIGRKPRVFIRIPSANLFIGTKTAQVSGVDYTDSIASFDTIRQSIDKYGGMSDVSSFGVRNLQLGSRFTLCTESVILPKREGQYNGSGRLYKEVTNNSYSEARNALIATDFGSPLIVVGRRYQTGTPNYQVIRGYLQVSVPTGLTTCEEAVIKLSGNAKNTGTNFNILLIQADWAALNDTVNIFNDFSSWQMSGAYNSVNLSDTWSTSSFLTSVDNEIRLNAAGRAYLVSMAGQTAKFMLLSSLDDNNDSAPTGDEYVQFENTATLNLRYNTKNLDNQDAEVYLCYDDSVTGIMPTAYTDMQLIWKGVVDDYSIDSGALNLKLKQNDHKKNLTIPKKIITIEDFPYCPDENLGKAYPIIYGDFGSGTGVNELAIAKETTLAQLSGVRDYIKGIVVNNGTFDAGFPIELLLSEKVIRDINNADAAAWLSNIKAFGRVWGYVALRQSTNTVIFYKNKRVYYSIEKDADEASVPYKNFGGIAVSVIPNNVYDSNGVTSPDKAFSGIIGDYAELANEPDFFEVGFPKIGDCGNIDRVEIVFDLSGNTTGTAYTEVSLRNNADIIRVDNGADGIITMVPITPFNTATFTSAAQDFTATSVVEGDVLYINSSPNRGKYTILSVDDAHTLTVRIEPYSITNTTGIDFQIGIITTPVYTSSCHGSGQRILDITDPALDGNMFDWNIENRLVKFKLVEVSPTTEKAQIRNIQIRYYTSNNEKANEYYFDSEGNYDDALGTVTGTANQLIENPSHIIESFARDEMSLVAAEINTTAFDTSATALTEWKFAFQINDRAGAREFLHNFYRQSRSKGLWDEQDRLSIKTFNASNHFSFSNSDTPYGLDIFDTTGSPDANGNVTTNPIFSINIDRVGLDDVKNDFILKYRKNYATDEFLETLYMSNGLGVVGDVTTNISGSYLKNSQTVAALSALCADSYNKIQTTNTIEFEADLIRDEATATMLLQYLIERMTKRRYIVTVSTMDSVIGHEQGDFINIRESRIYDLFGENTAKSKKWEIITKEINLNTMRINIESIEVE